MNDWMEQMQCNNIFYIQKVILELSSFKHILYLPIIFLNLKARTVEYSLIFKYGSYSFNYNFK